MARRQARPRRPWRSDGADPAPSHRLEALADGVFAIVMTLLVLELGVPAVSEATDAGLVEALSEMWREFLIYALSFLVLGAFWLIHKMIFDAILGSDPPLVWLSILFLMAAALIPFSTALAGQYGAMTIVALIYGLNMLAMFGTALAIWFYATRSRRLASPDLDQRLIAGANRMGLFYCALMAASVAVSFLSPVAAFAIYGGVVGLIIVSTMLGRWETVMVWAAEDDDRVK